MAIPINVSRLLEDHIVEQSRIEYKLGWNPESTLHTICAFANDIGNLGGGYLVIGVEEEQGRPKRPLRGLEQGSLDRVQKELIALCHRIEPFYLPECEPVQCEGASLLVVWAPGGYDRPYRAPVFPQNKKSEKAYYIRRYSSTVKANAAEEVDLREQGRRIPFDDRANFHATLDDLQFAYMEDYLRKVDSDVLRNSGLDSEGMAEALRAIGGPAENVRPLNVGLMMFSKDPEAFFPYARIEIVDIPDPAGKGMSEHIFRGPLDRQLSDALAFLRNYVIAERVYKVPDRAEAIRVYNYPYEAIEEALSNAVLHRSYEEREPITVRIESDCMRILSLPGPDRSISDDDLAKRRLLSKRYRNRRIGEFLKELDLIEGRNTGIPTMLRALEANGSDPPEFYTDDDRSYFEVVFKINSTYKNGLPERSDKAPPPESAQRRRRTREQLRADIVLLLSQEDLSRAALARRLGYKGASKALTAVTEALLAEGAVELTGSEFAPNSKLHLTKQQQ